MAEQSRIKKLMKNTGFGLISMAINLIVQFIARTFFVRILGAEYNGINGLFLNILQVLNIAELGFAYSVAYALYKPLQEGDERKISEIMNFLRRVYGVITCVVLIAGTLCIPFLQYLIKEDISTLPFNIHELRIFFAIYLVNTALSYVLSYKRTIITADQKSYLVSNVDYFGNAILYAVQILVLLLWKNYYVYLILMTVKTFLSNVIINFMANKKYPYLKANRTLVLEKAERNSIMKNVGAMFFHKIGTIIVYSTTTIIISAFVGLVDASKYVNYILIVNAVGTFINIIFNALTASVGNLCTTADEEYQYRVFRRVSYVSNFLAVFCFVCYVGLFTPFITIWVGGEMTFDFWTTVAIAASAFVTVIRLTVTTFKNAKGLFVKDWYKPLIEAGLGIALAVVLSFPLGTLGVVLGYMLPNLLIGFPIEVIVLFKSGFKQSNGKIVMQFVRTAGCILLAVLAGGLASYVCSLLGSGILWFVVKLVICIAIGGLSFVLFTFRIEAFKYYVSLVIRLVKKLFGKSETPQNVTQSAEQNTQTANNNENLSTEKESETK
ncbi:MAG: hypothetical protein J6C23_04420 [Clostridia bacterium]|nr:hypothetical protein [Clostridia bacterium]